MLVPIFNVDRYLTQCLRSLASQTLEDIEILCLNDGSTDRSLEIARGFANSDPRFRVVDKLNTGYGDTMNRGLAEARGQYVGIVESDDWAEPTMFEELYRIAQETHADVVRSNYLNYYTDPRKKSLSGTVTRVVDPALCGGSFRPLDHPHVFFQAPAIWTGLYRHRFLDENKISFLPTPGASYQDVGFAFKTNAAARRVAYSDTAYLHYRQDNEASSINSPGKVYCVADEYASITAFLEEKGMNEDFSAILPVARWGAYQWNIDRLAAPLACEFIDYASEQLRAELAAGNLDLSMADANQYRTMSEVIENPLRAKERVRKQAEALVSVIVPVHNSEHYLEQCLNSVLTQSLEELDVVIVDDGSVDRSIEIVERAFRSDPRVRLVSQNNRGLSAARNAGLDHAVAEFVTFMDDDDFYEPGSLEALFSTLKESGADLSMGSMHLVFESGTRSSMERRQDQNYYTVHDRGVKPVTPQLLKTLDISACNKMFRRAAIEDANLRFPEGLKYEDAYFGTAYLWLSKSIAFTPRDTIVYNYRRRRGSIMATSFGGSASARDHMEIAFRLLDFLKRNRLINEYGEFYLDFLRRYIDLAFAFTTADQAESMWIDLARWISYHFSTLSRIDKEKAEKLLRRIPPEYRREFVGSGAQSSLERARSKVYRTARNAFRRLSPDYRAAYMVDRHLNAMDAQLSVVSDALRRLGDRVASHTNQPNQAPASAYPDLNAADTQSPG